MHTLIGLVAALLALPTLPAAAAAPDTTLGFGLPRGAAIAVPHVEGQTIVDGARRIPVAGDELRFVGTAGTAYVVEVDARKILRVAQDGTTTRLGRTFGSNTRLAAAGDRLVTTRIRRDATSTLTVRSAATGQRLAQRRFQGRVSALDVAGDKVLFGGAKRTAAWNTATDATESVSKYGGYNGDLAADLVAVTSKPGIEGGCTDVVRISTRETVWSTCKASVLAFAPGGAKVATTGAYQDGPLGLVEMRTVTGQVLATYRSSGTTFLDTVRWETPEALLITLFGVRRTATARCTAAACELTGAPVRHG